jgi:hypothetical protein
VAGVKREKTAKVAKIAKVREEKSRSSWRSWRLGGSNPVFSGGIKPFDALVNRPCRNSVLTEIIARIL